MGHQPWFDFDAEASRAARDEAVERVEAHATPTFMQVARAALELVARPGVLFTTDDVWSVMGRAELTHERRAMGAVMSLAARDGLIEPTSHYKQSSMVACHSRPKRVWRRAGGQ